MATDTPPNDGEKQRPGKVKFVMVGEIVSIFQRGNAWYANYQVENRQYRTSLHTASLKEARRQAFILEADIHAGRFKVRGAVATVDEAVRLYKQSLRIEKRAAKTIVKYDAVLDQMLRLANRLKIATMDRLNLAFMDRYRAMRYDDGRAEKTVYNEATIVRQLVNFAIARDLVPVDPMKRLKLKKPKPTLQPCWTLEQVGRILAAAPDQLRPTLILLAETGMRFGELAWLTWSDIDWESNTIVIRAKDGWRPKSGDQRQVPISNAARAVLDALPRKWLWVTTMPATKQHSLPGRQWTERRLLSMLKAVLNKPGLPGKIHTFRHYFVSNALEKGIPTATVRAWVGHVDDRIIALYTHVHDEASQSAMRRLSQANGGDVRRTSDESAP